mmetsp:Transcript_72523/g.144044  ORF Transcript_72523/g.144044 Transcript_72523/m.144044 type:complete len:80 (+) Transcript_72523:69-308(+)
MLREQTTVITASARIQTGGSVRRAAVQCARACVIPTTPTTSRTALKRQFNAFAQEGDMLRVSIRFASSSMIMCDRRVPM